MVGGAPPDATAIRTRLTTAGMSAPAAERVARRLEALAARLPARDEPPRLWWVPGRIELLGKHTDYAGGRSLLCAVERGFAVAVAPRADDLLALHDARTGEDETLRLAPDADAPAGVPGDPPLRRYAGTVVRRLVRNFPGPLRGADVAFASDLPPAAGLSSSSALVTAVLLAVADVDALHERDEWRRALPDDDALAGYLGTVENGESFGPLAGELGVGTFGGSEDHTAILRARPGRIVQYAFAPVRFERAIALPADHVLVVADSGVVAEKTGNARARYNRAALAARAVAAAWRRATGGADRTIADAIAAWPDGADRVRRVLRILPDAGVEEGGERFGAPELLARFDHFVAESAEIIPAAGDALARGDLASFGALVDRSQHLGETLLGNQVPETIALAHAARELGAVAASAFGAGFGGSVWALVPERAAERFRERWGTTYRERFPEAAARASCFVTRAGPGVRRLSSSESPEEGAHGG